MPKRRLPLRRIDHNLPVPLNTCNAQWEEMSGDDRKRMCGMCDRSVTNLSNFSQKEAARFLEETERKECVTYELLEGEIVHWPDVQAEQTSRRRWTRPSTASSWFVALVLALMGVLPGCNGEGGFGAKPEPVVLAGAPVPIPTTSSSAASSPPTPCDSSGNLKRVKGDMIAPVTSAAHRRALGERLGAAKKPVHTPKTTTTPKKPARLVHELAHSPKGSRASPLAEGARYRNSAANRR